MRVRFGMLIQGSERRCVRWQLIQCTIVLLAALTATQASAQTDSLSGRRDDSDSVARMVFGDAAPSPQEREKPKRVLDMILTGGAGVYKTVRGDRYPMLFQPTASLDFYLEPGGLIGFLVGGHFGFGDRFTQGISFGVREKLGFLSTNSFNTFTEISALFFDDKEFARSFETGLRLALSTVFPQAGYGITARLAAEYRGRRREQNGTDPIKHLYYVGLEGGINFSMLGAERQMPLRDSLRAGLRHVLTSAELAEFDQLPDALVTTWYDRYWQSKDLTPATPLNEAKEEFEERVINANREFKKNQKLGVETDRGRLHIIYGRPNVIERGRSRLGEEAQYELWIYEQRLKGYPVALFLFESVGALDWMQVYSNVPGEISGRIPSGLPDELYQIIRRYVR